MQTKNINRIIKATTKIFGIPIGAIRAINRSPHICEARNALYYIFRYNSDLTLMQIAKLINRNDHTTVIKCAKSAQRLIESDKNYSDKIEQILQLIRN